MAFDHKISRGTLDALMRPASVAVIGASDDPVRIGGRPIQYLIESGFSGPIYPINPNRERVQGLTAYPAIGAVPGPVDVAIVALPSEAAVDAVEACAASGVKAAIVFTSGFAETGPEGVALQARLQAAAVGSGMRILGPNCLGVLNPEARFFGTFSASMAAALAEPGPVAIASQSGAVGGHLAYLCGQRGIGLSHWITTGNEADIDLSECLLWLARAPEAKVIVAYAEAVRDGATFIRALSEARANCKPLILLKVGRSQAGAQAAASHTGALAGADAVYDAVLKQYGVFRASSIEEMLDIAYACVRGVLPASRRLGAVTASGGVGVQMADAAERLGMDLAPMPLEAQERVHALLPFAGTANPIDVTAQVMNDLALFYGALDVTLRDGGYDSIIVFLSSGPATARMRDLLLELFGRLRLAYPDRLIVLSLVAPPETVRAFEAIGYPVFEDTDRALTAIEALASFSESFGRHVIGAQGDGAAPSPLALPERLDEHAAKAVLNQAGIVIWPESLAATPAEAAKAATAFAAPVALKIVSPDLPHKTEVGGVVLNLATPEAVDTAASAMLARISELRPDARITGLLVSPMASGGVEAICGAFRDPVFGPVIMFGLGGIFVEVLKDVVFRLAPFGEDEARLMIDGIRGRPILDGLRGQPAIDIDALATALARLSRFAHDHRDEVSEIDINPMLLRPDGAFALDGLITLN